MPGSNISEEVRNFLNTTENAGIEGFDQSEPPGVLQLLGAPGPPEKVNQNVAIPIQQTLIDAIKLIGIKDSITLTISVIMDFFRKCMLINEDMLKQVLSQRPQQGVS
jgi:hypothetical protein